MRRLLLQQCTDEQRFQITAKLCEDVLGGVADGTLMLDQSQGILGEGLKCFTCPSRQYRECAW